MRRTFRRLLFAASMALAVAHARERVADAQASGSDAEGLAHFQRGRQAFEHHDYRVALQEFQHSLARMPSPNTQLYIARSLRELGQLGDAYRTYAEAAHDADARASTEARYARTAQTARQEAQELAPRIARFSVVVTPSVSGLVATLNGQTVDVAVLADEYAVDPGPVTIELRAPGFAPYRNEFVAAAGDDLRFNTTLSPQVVNAPPPEPAQPAAQPVLTAAAPPPTPQENTTSTERAPDARTTEPQTTAPETTPPPAPATSHASGSAASTFGVATLGVGAVLFLVGVVGGVIALSTYNSLEHDCGDGMCSSAVPDVQSRVSTGHTAALVGDIGMIGGGVLMLVGVIVYAVGRPHTDASPAQARHRVWPTIDPSRGTVGIGATF